MQRSIQYDHRTKPIKSIQFSSITNDFVKRISAIKDDPNGITSTELIENLQPKKGAPNDRRMGPGSPHDSCDTCGLNNQQCEGHFGHIKTPRKVFHILNIDKVCDIMNDYCLNCSRFLIGKDKKKFMRNIANKGPKARYAEAKKHVKTVTTCIYCGNQVKKIKKSISAGIIQIIAQAEIKNTDDESVKKSGKLTTTKGGKILKKIALTPELCYEKLKNIMDEEIELIGLKTRPEELIIENYIVGPVPIRPSARADFTTTSTLEDHLTHGYGDIVKHANKIREQLQKEGANDKNISDNMHVLQYHCAILYDNEISGLYKSDQSRSPFKSLTKRLESKEGRIRYNLNGKRTNFSARTVITPDPNLALNELGVPLKIAMNQTFPEKVTPKNIERLTQLVKNGKHKYPGANYVISTSGIEKGGKAMLIDLRFRKDIPLQIGDIVERHMQNRDIVLFNRQPSLHKMSMMAFEAKIIMNPNISSFRFSPCSTKPFNADNF